MDAGASLLRRRLELASSVSGLDLYLELAAGPIKAIDTDDQVHFVDDARLPTGESLVIADKRDKANPCGEGQSGHP